MLNKLSRGIIIGLIIYVIFIVIAPVYIVNYKTQILANRINLLAQNDFILQKNINILSEQTQVDLENYTKLNSETLDVMNQTQGYNLLMIEDNYNKNKILKDKLDEVDLNTKKQITQLDERTKEPNIDYLLSTSVYVQGLTGSGSGTVIKKTENNMYILTCYHVIAEIDKLNKEGKSMGVGVGYFKKDESGVDQGIVMYGSEIVKVDETNDLALLKTSVTDSALNVATIATEQPQQGDTVYTCGNPLMFVRNLSKGILSNHLEGFYVVDALLTFGLSGGGLYDKSGTLIGVPAQVPLYYYNSTMQLIVPESSMGMCIDLLRIREFLGDLI